MTTDLPSPSEGAFAPAAPSRLFSVLYGAVGGMVLSVAGFVPWAVFGRWLYRAVGEAGLYAVCALVFMSLSGPLLHRLLAGPRRVVRFYKLFAVSFAAYAVAWIAGWMALGGHAGSVVGLLAGALAMAGVLVRMVSAPGRFLPVAAVLFGPTAVGYFSGGVIEGWLMNLSRELGSSPLQTVAMLSWGVFFGLGFGAGLGLAVHLCQDRASEHTNQSPATPIGRSKNP